MSALFSTKPPTIRREPKFRLMVVVMLSALPTASTMASWLVASAGSDKAAVPKATPGAFGSPAFTLPLARSGSISLARFCT